MSSAVGTTSAALGRPFLFDADPEPNVGHVGTAAPVRTPAPVGTTALGCPVERSSTVRRDAVESLVNQHSKIPPASITPASRLEMRPAPEMVTSGIPALDALTGGLPRGCLTEICGRASSGRTGVMLASLAAATRRGEYCAVIDASDALDSHSLAASGADLDRLLWVRCGNDIQQNSASRSAVAGASRPRGSLRPAAFSSDEKNSRASERCLEQVLRATDLLLESGGFGLIILDLADLPPQSARRIPLTTWFRFRRAVEHKPTILLAIEQQPIAGSCSSLLLHLRPAEFSGAISGHGISREAILPAHAHLLTKLEINAELIRSRLDRKPARSITFATKTAWAG